MAVRAVFVVFLTALTWGMSSGTARAGGDKSQDASRGADDLDGVYLMLGPVGGLSYRDRASQSIFGGQVLALRLRERASLTSLGVALQGVRYSGAERGRVSLDAIVGTRLWGIDFGVAAGPVAEVDRVVPPRWGAQATLWVFAGIVPYVRVGRLQGDETFLELGAQLMLPAWRL